MARFKRSSCRRETESDGSCCPKVLRGAMREVCKDLKEKASRGRRKAQVLVVDTEVENGKWRKRRHKREQAQLLSFGR